MISNKTIALIQQMKDEGSTQQEVAEVLEIPIRTIQRYWTKKMPASRETDTGNIQTDNSTPDELSSISDSNTSDDNLSSDTRQDKLTGRHFWFVVYPTKEAYEAYYEQHKDECDNDGTIRPHYDGSEGYGTAPDDWREQLRQTGLTFCVSPLHDRDVTSKEVDGVMKTVPKKPHYHVIVTWGNSTTYRAARQLCDILKSPKPQLLKNVKGAFRYHQHKDDPDKYQYEETSQAFNGWVQPLDSDDVARIKAEIADIIYLEDVQEYGELITVCKGYGPEYVDVASSHTIYCGKLCDSYRNNPMRCLFRYRTLIKDDAQKLAIIDERIRDAQAAQQEVQYESKH